MREIPASRLQLSTALATAAAASAAAGIVHGAAFDTHRAQSALAAAILATAVAQLLWAVVVLIRPTRRLATVGAALNIGALGIWAVTLAEAEATSDRDTFAAAFGIVAGVLVLVALVQQPKFARFNLGVFGIASVVILAIAVLSVAPNSVADSRQADQGVDGSADGGHAHTGTGDQIISLDDPRLTDPERARAVDLIERTRQGLAKFSDAASIVNAGYVTIGDGSPVLGGNTPGSLEHFVNAAFVTDGKELDADAIESIVLERQADGTQKVAAAMYVLTPGKTSADTPEIAGAMTVWHDHNNLCWDLKNTRIVGTFINGKCRPRGERQTTTPMIHVWIEERPCGPFEGSAGHGGSCKHED